MGVSVTHEPPSPPEGSPENSPTPPAGSGSPSPITPPTPSPVPGATDPAYLQLMRDTIADQSRRIQDMETRAAQTPAVPAAPPKTDEELRAEFYSNPQGATRQLIREELDASVGEIRDFVREFRGATATDNFVNQYKNDPRFSANWDASVERYVREQAAQMPPKNLNDNTFGFLVVSAIGLKASGMLQGGPPPVPVAAPPAPPAPPAPAPILSTPPYLHPSPPAGPTPDGGPRRHRPLNENEQRLLREYNAKTTGKKMTEAEYIQWQELPSADVANADFDKPKPPAPRA